MISIDNVIHNPNEFIGIIQCVEGFLVSDGSELWLTNEKSSWMDRRYAIWVGDKTCVKSLLERAPDLTVVGAVLLANAGRVTGQLERDTQEKYCLRFSRVDEIALDNEGEVIAVRP